MQVNLYCEQCSSPISIVVITQLISTILRYLNHHCFLTLNIHLCSPAKMRQFNATFRGIDSPTDILSFAPNNTLLTLQMYHLGDLIIVPSILAEYSKAHRIPLQQHWYHIITHGLLHLLGYDHIATEDALVMEALEQRILQQFALEVATQDFWRSS